MIKEIGSFFSLSEDKFIISTKEPVLLEKYRGKRYFYSTCRSAINEILKKQKLNDNPVAIVPPFTCYAVLEPFLRNNYSLIPYDIDLNLCLKKEEFIKLILKYKPSVILIHPYFGFHHTCSAICDFFENNREIFNNITIIEDITQVMFSNFIMKGIDYVVGSLRKWYPIPDGAIAISFKEALPNIENEDSILIELGKKALKSKQDYIDNKSTDKSFLDLFSQLEKYIDNQTKTFKISNLSLGIINSFNICDISKKRCENYFYLLNNIPTYDWLKPIFGKLYNDVVPFMFPILIKDNRKRFQDYMVKQKIYPTIIWGCPDFIKSNISSICKKIYDEIICLYCDQRYNIQDMIRTCECIKNYNKIYY